ncbi:MAG TPA: sn-glycerol-3-phosphate ABC transporter ATP-binding protein UgpC, partial [Acidimicrobiales bacterium]|nr:sn-glycerol-3-phosphate ABC transporter ATP-binding protein UgpC [Acidimicrobiales bacterium]
PHSQRSHRRFVPVSEVRLEGVSKVYPNGTHAVDDLSLDVPDGELMVIVGPSGCGKTTALRLVAGLEEVTSGTVRIGQQVVNDLAPRDRDVAMVFQNYALYPHMTVAENIGFALRVRRLGREEARARVEDAARVLGITDLLERKPAQLSGGQRQRVAMGRAIVREPAVFLMDEPLSNLDAKLRVQMRAEVARVQRRLGVAALYVTHDQTEAMTLGDRVAVMRDGRLQQCDPPQVVYDRPANVFVAAFIGSPPVNLYAGRISEDGASVVIGRQALSLPDRLRTAPALGPYRGGDVVVGIRPEDMSDDPARHGAGGDGVRLEGRVELVEHLGPEKLVHFRLDVDRLQTSDTTPTAQQADDVGVLAQGQIGSEIFAAAQVRVGVTSPLAPGQTAVLSVDTERLLLFDSGSGALLDA